MESPDGLVQYGNRALRDALLRMVRDQPPQRRRGRPRHRHDLVARILSLRSEGRRWPQITFIVNKEFGLTLTREAVRKVTAAYAGRPERGRLFYALRGVWLMPKVEAAIISFIRSTPQKQRGRPQEIELAEWPEIFDLLS